MNVSICGGKVLLQTELGIESFPLLRRVFGHDCRFIVPRNIGGDVKDAPAVVKANSVVENSLSTSLLPTDCTMLQESFVKLKHGLEESLRRGKVADYTGLDYIEEQTEVSNFKTYLTLTDTNMSKLIGSIQTVIKAEEGEEEAALVLMSNVRGVQDVLHEALGIIDGLETSDPTAGAEAIRSALAEQTRLLGVYICTPGLIDALGAQVSGMSLVCAQSTKQVFAVLGRDYVKEEEESHSTIEEAINDFPSLSHVLSPSLFRYVCNRYGTPRGQDMTTFVRGFHPRNYKGVAVWAFLEFLRSIDHLYSSGYEHVDLSNSGNIVFDPLKMRCVFIDVGLRKKVSDTPFTNVLSYEREETPYNYFGNGYISTLWHYAYHHYRGATDLSSDFFEKGLEEYQVLGNTLVVKISPTKEFLEWQVEVAKLWGECFEDVETVVKMKKIDHKKLLALPRPPLPPKPFTFTACEVRAWPRHDEERRALKSGYDMVRRLYGL